jgi:hypothetical protein
MKGGYDHRMRIAATAIALAVFALNPSFGCGAEEFDFGPDEMKRVVEGTWDLTLDGDPDAHAVILVSHSPVRASAPDWSPLRSAHACGNRSFIAEAGACGAYSTMTFNVQTVTLASPFRSALTADLRVGGSTFRQGRLTFQFEGGGHAEIDLRADGTVFNAQFAPVSPGPGLPGLRAVRRP